MIKGLGFRVYDLIKLVIKTSICTPSSCYKNVALAGHPNSCSLTRKAGVFVHNFFQGYRNVASRERRERFSNAFVRLYVCLFVPLRIGAAIQRVCFFVFFFFQQLALGQLVFSFFPGFGTENGVQRIITPGPCSVIIHAW